VTRAPAAALFALTLMSACTTEGLAFIRDERVRIVRPDYREVLELPATLDWEVTDDALAQRIGDDVQFGLLMDIDPQPQGESLDYFGRDDPTCRRDPGCPDEQYLRQRGVHVTSETEITFNNLPIAPGVDLEGGQSDIHFATLILLDSSGARLGESAWQITFEIDREGT
jgi:hypothetical protein